MQWLVVIYIHRTTSLSLAIIPIFHDKTDQRRDICTNSAYTMIFYCVLWVLIGWSSYNLMHLSMRNTYTWYMTGTVHVHCTMGCQVFVWFCAAPKMRRSLNSPFLVQHYILEELSVVPSIPVISYIKSFQQIPKFHFNGERAVHQIQLQQAVTARGRKIFSICFLHSSRTHASLRGSICFFLSSRI